LPQNLRTKGCRVFPRSFLESAANEMPETYGLAAVRSRPLFAASRLGWLPTQGARGTSQCDRSDREMRSPPRIPRRSDPPCTGPVVCLHCLYPPTCPRKGILMFSHNKRLQYTVRVSETNP